MRRCSYAFACRIFFSKKSYDSIQFYKTARSAYRFTDHIKEEQRDNHTALMQFMETVFINCGTYSLEQQLKPVPLFSRMQIGDVFVKGGAPGHAEMVIDMAVNKQTGRKIFMLAEGYMPAQDMHIVLNPSDAALGPWYELKEQKNIMTATWIFTQNQLRHW